MLDPAAYLATLSQRVGDTPQYVETDCSTSFGHNPTYSSFK